MRNARQIGYNRRMSQDSTASGAKPIESRLSRADALLTIVHPVTHVGTHPLGAVRCVAGRKPGADETLTIDHPTVSRQHLSVEWDARARVHRAQDLGSRNGSFLMGRALAEPRELSDGDVLRIGDVLVIYEHGPGLAVGPVAAVSRDALPGRAACLGLLREALLSAAADEAPALLIGETGVGKERLAGELHRLSRRSGPLLAVNCAALSAELIESQLFGHLKGAFTGAHDNQPGMFRAADRGTLFLDEIGDLPLPLQPKLLRVLESREVLPVGATRAVPVDVRVVAATHRDLQPAASSGEFRLDLYARLSMWELRVPPLRQRRVDLFDWLRRLLPEGKSAPRLDADAAEALLLNDWLLNLRGLHRLARELGRRGGLIHAASLPPWLSKAKAAAAAAEKAPAGHARRPSAQARPTRAEFEAAFTECAGSIHALARFFDRDRRQIYRWLDLYGMRDRADQ
jgi:Sigma-54 interaction domain/FHA domain